MNTIDYGHADAMHNQKILAILIRLAKAHGIRQIYFETKD